MRTVDQKSELAFAHHHGCGNRDGDRYAGNYCCDESTGQVQGCPARAPAVTSLLHAIKIRASVKGAAATRQHAEAISIEEIQTLMQWSERTCPNELLEMPVPDVETLMFRLEHALMRAFVTSAFTLWTRWCSL